MKAAKLLIFFLAMSIVINASFAFQANSSSYRHFTGTVSAGGDIVNNSNYKSYVATGVISGAISSSSYRNFLGFFYTWLLADNQPCTSGNQCQGGFCCSNSCKSSSCPTAEAAAAGGGGEAGAAGGGFFELREEKDFAINPENVKVNLVLGESTKKTLAIENTGKTEVGVSLDVEGIGQYLTLSEDSVYLGIDEGARITLDFIGRNVGSFVGSIRAIADGVSKIVPVIVEVITKLVLFDVKLDIPAEYAEIEPGNELRAQITLLNVGAPERVDVFAAYFIKDLRGNIIYEQTETFAVEKQMSYQKSLPVHQSTVPGSYVAVVEIRYADSFAVSSQLFRVAEKKGSVINEIIAKNISLMVFASFILIGVISALIYKLVSAIRKGKKKSKKKQGANKSV